MDAEAYCGDLAEWIVLCCILLYEGVILLVILVIARQEPDLPLLVCICGVMFGIWCFGVLTIFFSRCCIREREN